MKKRTNQMLFHIIVAVYCVGCGTDSPNSTQPDDPNLLSPKVSDSNAEEWISKPKAEWPQIVLTNHAEFNGDRSLYGASSFLIEPGNGRVLAATAAHLLGPAGGVEPKIPINQLTAAMRSWKMFPRTMSNESIEITSLGVKGLEDENLDWLILKLKNTGQFPAYPLKMRKEPIRVGETVFLIGCPYLEQNCKQNVYSGIVTKREYGNRFRYDIDTPVNIRGFSGAPIIDEKGYLVGVMTVWFDPKMSGEKYLEAGGEDLASIYNLLKTDD